MEANPLDDLASQLPGRLFALEVLLVLLLRAKPQAGRLLREADQILVALEGEALRGADEKTADYSVRVFNAARESLENLARQARSGKPR